ncbi:methyltransferase-like protein 22 isoform X4 [Oryctolagus cuniculus]|uniref:methyltransferase-like protein 22 isoform X4 n=1 Tax=Oryctolagus cuniculus TaxID=9986 RepID=UPI00048E351D|nr:methyltransferase-like protein 22 isoform X4 [Oryctolagus cuniculus]
MVQLVPAPAMDEITFRSDTVLSDVHLYTPNHRHLMVRLNGVGQPVFLSQFKLLWSRDSQTEPGAESGGHSHVHAEGTPPGSGCTDEGSSLSPGAGTTSQEGAGAQLDEDGDLDVERRPRATSDPDPAEPPRDKVQPVVLAQEEDDGPGDEAWDGSALGVIRIDVGADLLSMCQRNIALNSHLAAPGGGTVKVKELDWLKDDLCTDPEVPFSWSEEDVCDLYAHTTVLLAAEVFYDDDLTDALFKTLSRLAHRFHNACTAILAVEKRLNFTLRHLDVTCEAYDHFRASLQALQRLPDSRLRFVVEPVEASFPQLLLYERIRQLELWKIIAEPVT